MNTPDELKKDPGEVKEETKDSLEATPEVSSETGDKVATE